MLHEASQSLCQVLVTIGTNIKLMDSLHVLKLYVVHLQREYTDISSSFNNFPEQAYIPVQDIMLTLIGGNLQPAVDHEEATSWERVSQVLSYVFPLVAACILVYHISVPSTLDY